MSALTPAPALDAIFDGAPPTADEWRDMAHALARVLEGQERPFSRGTVTRERILKVTLDGVRKGLPN